MKKAKDQGSWFALSLLREEYVNSNRNSVISPIALADAVYRRLDPAEAAPAEVNHLALLELRQLARQICAEEHHEQESQIESEGLYEQQEMFEGLQHRYPARRDGDDAYVLLDDLTELEVRSNASRLMSEGQAKIGHARALNVYLNRKFGSVLRVVG